MKKIAMACGVLVLWLGACADCGGEEPPPPPPPQYDGGNSDASTGADSTVDAGVLDGSGDDAAPGDATDLDAATSDTAGDSDAAGAEDAATEEDGAAPLDAGELDATLEDAGQPLELQLQIKVDELGVDEAGDVQVQFVLLDWDALGGPVVCEDGGPGDAAGTDSGGLNSWRTAPIGQPATLSLVSRTLQHFSMQVPAAPPGDHLTPTPDDRCGVNTDVRMAMYQPIAYLEGSDGTADSFDDADDILGMGEAVPYAGGTGSGTAMLVWVEGSSLPFGLSHGWNYLIVGLADNAPDPEGGDLASAVYSLSITSTPHETLQVSGQLLLPGGGSVTTNPDRRVAFLAGRVLGGVSEIAAIPATGTTYSLELPADLGSATLSEFVRYYGPLGVASGLLVAYDDANSDHAYAFGEEEGATNQSCPMREIWYLPEALPWPWVMMTRSRLGRGYNIVTKSWDADKLQLEPDVDLPETSQLDIDIPYDSDADWTNSDELTADTGCACGLIPAPYTSGCQ